MPKYMPEANFAGIAYGYHTSDFTLVWAIPTSHLGSNRGACFGLCEVCPLANPAEELSDVMAASQEPRYAFDPHRSSNVEQRKVGCFADKEAM